jgi:Importin-beta N-terminal domain
MEQLVEELVAPSSRPSPARVVEIQKEIQQLQRQPTGWQLGIALLKKSSSQLRFYGALTLTIKIQTDW